MAGTATAATVHYDSDPEHTFPRFEADHLAGLSVWRGKFHRSSGRIALHRAAGTGPVALAVDTASIAFRLPYPDAPPRGASLFHAWYYPTAPYTGLPRDFSSCQPPRTGRLLPF